MGGLLHLVRRAPLWHRPNCQRPEAEVPGELAQLRHPKMGGSDIGDMCVCIYIYIYICVCVLYGIVYIYICGIYEMGLYHGILLI